MPPIDDIVQLAIAIVSGGLGVKIIDWLRDARAGHLQKRRAEVDKAIAERDKALAARDDAETALARERAAHVVELRWWERWTRILEEALSLARRRFIDAPCTDPDELDPYPSRPDTDKP